MQARACPASAASALGITFTVPPHSRQVSMSISPKAPTFGEHTFQALRPAHREGETGTRSRGWPGPCPSLGGGLLLALVGGVGLVAPTPLGRRHQRTVFAVRGKDTVETRQVDAGLGHQGGQPGDKIQGHAPASWQTITRRHSGECPEHAGTRGDNNPVRPSTGRAQTAP